MNFGNLKNLLAKLAGELKSKFRALVVTSKFPQRGIRVMDY